MINALPSLNSGTFGPPDMIQAAVISGLRVTLTLTRRMANPQSTGGP